MRNVTELVSPSSSHRFGRFELRPSERVLLADGAPVTIGARAFDLLIAFADRPGTLITKDDLLATVWPGVVVEENNLQVQVSTLRKIIGQNALATIPGRGYRFNLAVSRADAHTPAPPVDNRAPAVDESDETKASKARTNLPLRLPMLYGRADDLAAVAALLREHPVVTITGSGGIGKTRVAQAVAETHHVGSRDRLSGWRLVGGARRPCRWRARAFGRGPGDAFEHGGRAGFGAHAAIAARRSARICWCSTIASTWRTPWPRWSIP